VEVVDGPQLVYTGTPALVSQELPERLALMFAVYILRASADLVERRDVREVAWEVVVRVLVPLVAEA
jgi:hypothetical protein